jgi:hypothetical protein
LSTVICVLVRVCIDQFRVLSEWGGVACHTGQYSTAAFPAEIGARTHCFRLHHGDTTHRSSIPSQSTQRHIFNRTRGAIRITRWSRERLLHFSVRSKYRVLGLIIGFWAIYEWRNRREIILTILKQRDGRLPLQIAQTHGE